jgi:hypothetical protein
VPASWVSRFALSGRAVARMRARACDVMLATIAFRGPKPNWDDAIPLAYLWRTSGVQIDTAEILIGRPQSGRLGIGICDRVHSGTVARIISGTVAGMTPESWPACPLERGTSLREWRDMDVAYRHVGLVRSDQHRAAAEYAIGL